MSREPGNECPDCGGQITRRICQACGWTAPGAKAAPPIYREFVPRIWQDGQPSDRCPEEGCSKTVGDHIAEFRAHCRQLVSGVYAGEAQTEHDRKKAEARRRLAEGAA